MLPLQDFLTPPPPTPTLPPAGAAPAPVVNATPTPLPTLPVAPVTGAPAASQAAPGAPADVALQPLGQQGNLAALVALFIYLAFWGVLGYRRGTQRELVVFVTALGLSFILQRFSQGVVTVFDRFGKGLAFLTGQQIPQQSGLGAWAAANTETLLILLWLGVMVFVYIMTGEVVRKSKKDGWAVLLGILNGLIFASIFAPLLTALILPGVAIQGPVVQLPVLGFLSNVWEQLSSVILRAWEVIQPVATNVFFLAVTLLILLAALTLRTRPKAKS